MAIADEQLEEALVALCQGCLSDAVRKSAEAGDANLIVSRLVWDQTSDGTSIEDALDSALQVLETYAERDPFIARVLMLHLWAKAAGVIGMHDVSDSIDLWVYDMETVDFSTILASPFSHGLDIGTKAHFKSVIEAKQSRR